MRSQVPIQAGTYHGFCVKLMGNFFGEDFLSTELIELVVLQFLATNLDLKSFRFAAELTD